MTRDDNVLLNDVYFNAYNTNSPLTPLTPISKLFAPFEAIGVHSGVPTRTTPTLTPTTLKNIEQSIMGLTSDNQINLPYQAGFVPPPFPLEELSQDREASQESFSSTSNASWAVSGSGHGYGADDVDSKSSTSTLDPPLSTNSSSNARGASGQRYGAVTGATGRPSSAIGVDATVGGGGGGGGGAGGVAVGAASVAAPASASGGRTRRNVGGRRPHKPSNLSPEEEEKRRIRRERNKQAAARCRRRREDHTNELVDETDQLEKQNQQLHQEVQSLKQEVQQLERIMDSHRDQPCQLRNRRTGTTGAAAGAGGGNSNAVPAVPPGEQQPPPVVLPAAGGNGGLASNPATLLLPLIKTEPEEDLADIPQHHQQPQDDQQDAYIARGAPPMKKIKIPPNQSDSLETPTPTTVFPPHSLLSPGLTGVKLSGGAASNNGSGTGRRPDRPRSLLIGTAAGMLNSNGHSALAGSGAGGVAAAAAAAAAVAAVGGGLSTPSNGLFNFDSLMEGGTGLTPIAAPISFPPNRNPLELITPTSTDSSKLCSL
ncbi:transcription factor kayak isoform X2 [Anopheles aquasalis]|uniref:transcription factor kayak isoform X2 n=1 Tax=Anopheles aquasalis TaxID=42839 RepID=UPI00215A1F9D|nr:transcription factor kayak isoform X2 [Anopheles aquasalis]